METEEMVLSIEQMQHLKELGLNVEKTALCWWRPVKKQPFVLAFGGLLRSSQSSHIEGKFIPTLTLQEILELLPERIIVETKFPSFFKFHMTKKCMMYDNAFNLSVHHEEIKSSMLYSAYRMLCWVLENSYLKCK